MFHNWTECVAGLDYVTGSIWWVAADFVDIADTLSIC